MAVSRPGLPVVTMRAVSRPDEPSEHQRATSACPAVAAPPPPVGMCAPRERAASDENQAIMHALRLSAAETRWLELACDPQADAERVKLVYVSDSEPGFGRRRCGQGFAFLDVDGDFIKDEAIKARCKALAIPPAWREVWICPDARGHIQATGRDEKGRKQYIYHEAWQRVRAETKFNRMLPFGRALPLLRAATRAALRGGGVDHDRVVAALVALLDRTFLRIGNEEYAARNDHYGLTTLRERHVEVIDDKTRHISLDFRGKGGSRNLIELDDRRVARVVRACHELPGQRLFKYLAPDGSVQPVTSCDVNAWLRRVTGLALSAKDFRTWGGCVCAGELLAARPEPRAEREARAAVREVLEQVGARLGNTATVCRKYYVHPRLLESFAAGELAAQWRPDAQAPEASETHYASDELCLLGFLRRVTAAAEPRAAARRGGRRA